ncbi:hypothetical protein [Methanoculleus sp.]|nr:hypothetical protein [Methanoculleus sp.]MCK9319217.1 hypothetical protein [Methanoculleus sp.]
MEKTSQTKNKNISVQDNRKLVDVFAWLIEEDKKQNPDYYNKLKSQKYD